MPTKQPFTEAGVNLKIAELYALSDIALAAEAQLLKDDFIGWMDDNFNLTTEQLSYLDSMNADAREYLADRLSFSLVHRLDIVFTKEDPTTTGYVKWTDTRDKTQTRTNAAGDFEVTGSFEVAIVYEY